MKGIIYENALKFKAEMLKIAGIALCTPLAAIILKGLIDKNLLRAVISWEMFMAICAFSVGIWVVDLAYKVLAWLDEVKYTYDD